MYTFLVSFCLWLYLFASPASVLAVQNFVVPWSTKKFGPDGPWQAVTITVGGNDSSLVLGAQNTTQLSVYPGGEWQSTTFTEAACVENPDSFCGAGGTWDPDVDDVMWSPRIGFSPSWNENASGIHVSDITIIALGLTIDQKTVWNATLGSSTTGTIRYPNGRVGVPLGTLSLGAEDTKQIFSLGDQAGSSINASLFSGQLYENGEIPSYSYGLHIGSAAFDYPGSLAFGGYNKGRVVGPVTSFQDQKAIDLIDIGIGVEYGASPFNFTSRDKLLSTGQTKVTPSPLQPYLFFPRETCDGLADLLPVTYDQSLKYYLWNTDDPLFTRIVSSPAYLSFAFPPGPGDRDNVLVKVPFALLNLTLDSPISDTRRQYFPCMPYDDGPPVLGRAFLQAAFIGRNWNTQTSWLAQAPGPGVARRGLGDQYLDIAAGATMIEGFSDTNLFNDSWRGHWSIIQSATDNPSSGGTNLDGSAPSGGGATSSGLSTGARAGIGIGAALGGIALLAAIFFFWRRRTAKNKLSQPVTQGVEDPSPNDGMVKYSHHQTQGANGWDDSTRPSELPGQLTAEPVEVPDTSGPYGRY